MNERIEEFAKDCKILGEKEFAGKVVGFNYKKFAELIVRECSKVIVNGGYRNPALGEKHPLTPPEIATMIKEHFGVEE